MKLFEILVPSVQEITGKDCYIRKHVNDNKLKMCYITCMVVYFAFPIFPKFSSVPWKAIT